MKTMSLNSIQLTNKLRQGIDYSEVESILGKPKSTRTEDGNRIARYNLQEKWRAYVPYAMVFDLGKRTLISWSGNTREFEQSQARFKVFADEVTKQAESANTGQTGNTGGGFAPDFQNNPELMEYFAGMYYSFSAVGRGQTGSTERKMSLCGDGRYTNYTESGYAGDVWGTASQGGGSGTWRINGTKTSGTIVPTGRNGKTYTYKYESCGDGCIYLGNIKFACAGVASCK